MMCNLLSIGIMAASCAVVASNPRHAARCVGGQRAEPRGARLHGQGVTGKLPPATQARLPYMSSALAVRGGGDETKLSLAVKIRRGACLFLGFPLCVYSIIQEVAPMFVYVVFDYGFLVWPQDHVTLLRYVNTMACLARLCLSVGMGRWDADKPKNEEAIRSYVMMMAWSIVLMKLPWWRWEGRWWGSTRWALL